MTDLLLELFGLHAGFDDLEGDNLPGRSATIVSFSSVADGETTFAQSTTGYIADAAGLGDDGRRRVGVD